MRVGEEFFDSLPRFGGFGKKKQQELVVLYSIVEVGEEYLLEIVVLSLFLKLSVIILLKFSFRIDELKHFWNFFSFALERVEEKKVIGKLSLGLLTAVKTLFDEYM